MGAISAAIVVLSGALLIAAGSLAKDMTAGARQRLAGFGFLVFAVGTVSWMILLITELTNRQ